jgi:hypothetical protein
VPAPGNVEHAEPEPEPEAIPTATSFDGGARQSTPPLTDPARDHAALLTAAVGPRVARRNARGGWDFS